MVLEVVTKGTARQNRPLRKEIESIVEDQFEAFVTKWERDQRAYIEATPPRGIWEARKLNGWEQEEGLREVLVSKAKRSWDSASGEALWEEMARRIGALNYKVAKRVTTGDLTPDQRSRIDELIDGYDNHSIHPSPSNYLMTLPYAEIGDTGQTWLEWRDEMGNTEVMRSKSVLDGDYVDEAEHHHLIELKVSGQLNSKASAREKAKLLAHFFGLQNELGLTAADIGKIYASIDLHLCTVEDREQAQVSSSVRQFFAPEEVVTGREFFRFITCLEDGFETVMGAMSPFWKERDAVCKRLVGHHYFTQSLDLGATGDDIEAEVEDDGMDIG